MSAKRASLNSRFRTGAIRSAAVAFLLCVTAQVAGLGFLSICLTASAEQTTAPQPPQYAILVLGDEGIPLKGGWWHNKGDLTAANVYAASNLSGAASVLVGPKTLSFSNGQIPSSTPAITGAGRSSDWTFNGKTIGEMTTIAAKWSGVYIHCSDGPLDKTGNSIPGVDGTDFLSPTTGLKKSNNLSDISSASTARNNLGLGSIATKAAPSGTAVLKADGSGNPVPATPGTDFQVPAQATVKFLDGSTQSFNNADTNAGRWTSLQSAITAATGHSGSGIDLGAGEFYSLTQNVTLPTGLAWFHGKGLNTVVHCAKGSCTGFIPCTGCDIGFLTIEGATDVDIIDLGGSSNQPFGSTTGSGDTQIFTGVFVHDCAIIGSIDGLNVKQDLPCGGVFYNCQFSGGWDLVRTSATIATNHQFDFCNCSFIAQGRGHNSRRCVVNSAGTLRFFNCTASADDSLDSGGSGSSLTLCYRSDGTIGAVTEVYGGTCLTQNGNSNTDLVQAGTAVLKVGPGLKGTGTNGVPTSSGTITWVTVAPSQLPSPTSSTLGGVKSAASVSHQFVNQIGTDGSISQSQPAASDISGLAASATTDTTNASNISSGTLNAARLPSTAATTAAALTDGAVVVGDGGSAGIRTTGVSIDSSANASGYATLSLTGSQAIASSANATWAALFYNPSSVSVTGSTNITGSNFNAARFNSATLTASNPITITKSATMKVNGAPIAGSNITITNPYAFWVGSGVSQFDGNIVGTGHETFEGVTSTGATGTGKFVFDASPAFTGTPTAPTASANNNSTQIATTAYVDGKTRYYTIPLFYTSTGTPTSSTSLYFGHTSAIAGSSGTSIVGIPISGTITNAEITTISGNSPTSETSTISVLKNGTTASTLTSSFTNNSPPKCVNVTGLSIAVAAGDYIEIKWDTPAWSTPPTTTRLSVVLAISY